MMLKFIRPHGIIASIISIGLSTSVTASTIQPPKPLPTTKRIANQKSEALKISTCSPALRAFVPEPITPEAMRTMGHAAKSNPSKEFPAKKQELQMSYYAMPLLPAVLLSTKGEQPKK